MAIELREANADEEFASTRDERDSLSAACPRLRSFPKDPQGTRGMMGARECGQQALRTRILSRGQHADRFRTVKDVMIALNSAALRQQRVREGHITQGRMNYGVRDGEKDGWEVDQNQIVPLDLSVYTTGGYIRISAKAV